MDISKRIEGYQGLANGPGTEVYVKDMTKEQLQLEVCQLMDLIAWTDDNLLDLRGKIKLWRKGELKESDLESSDECPAPNWHNLCEDEIE